MPTLILPSCATSTLGARNKRDLAASARTAQAARLESGAEVETPAFLSDGNCPSESRERITGETVRVTAYETTDEDRALRRRIDRAYVRGRRIAMKVEEDLVALLKRIDRATDIPIIVTPEGYTVIQDGDVRSSLRSRRSLPFRHVIEHMFAENPELRWTIRHGVVIVTSRDHRLAGTNGR